MDDDLCRRCGWVLTASVTACPACGERLGEGAGGYETVFFPAGSESGGRRDVPIGTAMLRDDAATSGGEDLKLKLRPHLLPRGGPRSGQRLNVACPTTTVGREGGEISLDDPTLSSRHFMIEERGHEFFLRDLGSTNGTFLNGHLVRSSPLKSGDEIKAGKSVFVFSVLEVIPCD